MTWRLQATPPLWYCVFWTAFLTGGVTALFYVIKWAVIAALAEAR